MGKFIVPLLVSSAFSFSSLRLQPAKMQQSIEASGIMMLSVRYPAASMKSRLPIFRPPASDMAEGRPTRNISRAMMSVACVRLTPWSMRYPVGASSSDIDEVSAARKKSRKNIAENIIPPGI